MRNVRRWQAAWVIAALIGLGGASVAQDAYGTQLETAIQHAGFATAASDRDEAVQHLGHVLNCIVGEEGEGFDAAHGNPCSGQGIGIESDIEAYPLVEDVRLLLVAARQLAQAGLEAPSLEGVRAAAAGVRAILTTLQEFGI
jgi:hypothetical protein